ncbi:MAG: hypothetical protein RIR12_620 [Bacteroidota bacterium]
MKLKLVYLLLFFVGLYYSQNSFSQISGTVFRDYNGNGAKDNTAPNSEIFVQGISVRAYNAANVQIGATKVTDANGAYNFTNLEITPGTAVRIEFSGLGAGDFSSSSGTGNGTNVQFTSAPNSTINYAVINPYDYMETNPYIATPISVNGDPLGGGTAGTLNAFAAAPYNYGGTGLNGSDNINLSQARRIGATWGVAYERKTRTIFTSSVHKRHVGFGPNTAGTAPTTGGIYAINFSNPLAPGTPVLWLDVNTLLGVNTGTNPHTGLNADANVHTRDIPSFAQVGKISLGDLDISDNGDTLYVINLNAKQLLKIRISDKALLANITIPNPGCTNSDNTYVAAYRFGINTAYTGLGLNWQNGSAIATGITSTATSIGLDVNPTSAPDTLFKNAALGNNMAFNIPSTPNGTYKVTMYFREYLNSPGTRVFDILAEGVTRVNNFDIIADNAAKWGWLNLNSVGGNNGNFGSFGSFGNEQTFNVTVTDGALNLGISWVSGFTPLISGIKIENVATVPGSAANDFRPWAIGINKGEVYVGGVCSGETSGLREDLSATIYKLNGLSFTSVSSFPLNYIRDYAVRGPANLELIATWEAWNDNTTLSDWHVYEAVAAYGITLAQPILSDIAFDQRDNMIVSLMDRGGHQMGYGNFMPDLTDTKLANFFASGDLIKICNNGAGVFTVEGQATGCAQSQAGGLPTTMYAYNGKNGGENFYADNVNISSPGNFHDETNFGSLASHKGYNSIISTNYDPYTDLNAGGFVFQNASNGLKLKGYEVYGNTIALGNTPEYFGKSIGLGDIEILSDPLPIQIGNRIWLDTDGDGIQEAGETTAGVPSGTTVTLRSPGVDGIYGNGDDQTWTTTTNASGNYYFSALSSSDNRKPVSWTGIGNTLLPGYEYRIEVATPTGTSLTKTDAASNGQDHIDSDAVLNGANAFVIFNTSNINHNYDIGFKTLASIGDKVWRDDNKDGIQDTGEPGVAGITVMLYQNGTDGVPGNTDDIIIGTTVTDAYGIYLFDNLSPSTNAATSYSVGFTLPANYQFTTQTNTQVTGTSDATNTTTTTGGSTAANGSDASTTTGRTGSFWLTAGEAERRADAGLQFNQPNVNSIGDRVWLDIDNDGIQDATEAGVSGVTVTLYASDGVTVMATTVSDANGNYLFTNLADGNYRVGFSRPAGLLFTAKGTDNISGGVTDSMTDSDVNTTGVNFSKTDIINLDAASASTIGVNYTNVDGGLIVQTAITGCLGDKAWIDVDNDGVQDAGEPGLPGVLVTLYAGNGTTVLATTTTDAFGYYIFNNLNAANYVLSFGTAPGYNRSTNQFLGGNVYNDNNVFPATGRTSLITLLAGTRDLSIDAAYVSTSPNSGRIGDRVWFDADKNGNQDAGEVGVAGVTVTLYNITGALVGSPTADVFIASQTTDINGNYQFTNLPAGNYSVAFSNIPAGYSLTTSTGTTPSTITINSDANPGISRTATFALATGESLQGLDAGLVAGVAGGLVSVGNKVWWDLDGDNLQDAGEPGVGGVTVTLLDAGLDGVIGNADDGVSSTTTTNALGEYLFSGLPAGNYAVQFGTGTTLPAGAIAVTQNSGLDDAIDSDGGAISGGTSTTAVYNISVGQDNLTVDLGIRNTAKGSFGDRVWYDNGIGGGTANDGILNGTEIGVAGVMVTLVNAAGQTIDRAGNVTTSPIVTTTDANGYYAFADLTATVSFAAKFSNLPAGYEFTTKAGTGSGDNGRSDVDLISGLTTTVTIVANTHNTTLDAGISSTMASLGNFVWLDNDGDGTQDVGEPAVPGVTVSLFRPGIGLDGIAGNGDDNLAVATMITDQNGAYLFSNLMPGTYQVEFSTIPSGLSYTQQNSPGDNQNNTNSDAVPVVGNTTLGRTANIALAIGEVDLTIDAGLFKPRAVIGNYVWADIDSDGIQDAGEPGAGAVTVSLINSLSTVVAIAVTDGNGFYQFPNVAPGTYSISFANLPNGTSFTTPKVTTGGGNDINDSDVIGTTISGILVLTTTVNLNYDAGIINFRTLPISKLLATATLAGDVASINWLTENEVNTSHFIVERSIDGANFTEIGQLAAGGNTTGEATYTLPNNIAGLTNKVYYRIKVVEADGKMKYSNIVTVNINAGSKVKIWPNPFVDQISISLKADRNTQITVSIMDMMGRIYERRTYTVVRGTNQLSVNKLSKLAAGTYTVKVTTEQGELLQSIKLVK